MPGQSVSSSLYLGLMVILAFVFIIVLFAFIKNMGNIDEQMAFINVQTLKAKMDEACRHDTSSMKDFKLTQPTPPKFGAIDFLPRMIMKAAGDPSYVVYHEAFPPGEAIGWEVYDTDFHYRLISPFIYTNNGAMQTEGIDSNEFFKQLKVHMEHAEAVAKSKITSQDEESQKFTVFVNNIELNDYTDVFPGVERAESFQVPGVYEKDISELGKWDEERTRYKFYGYQELSALKKTAIKYRPCGNNYLCMKTAESVYRFKLDDACSNIAFIQIAYDVDPTTGESIVSSIFGGFTNIVTSIFMPRVIAFEPGNYAATVLYKGVKGFKTSEFYLASPCAIPGTIEIQRGFCSQPAEGASVGIGACNKIRGYPIYGVSKDVNDVMRIEFKGYHYYCLDDFGEDMTALSAVGDSIPQLPAGFEDTKKLECLKVIIREPKKNFCWTSNPKTYPEPSNSLWTQFKKIISAQAINVGGFFHNLGYLPITRSTEYFEMPQTVVLEPLSAVEGFLKDIQRYLSGVAWSWP